MRKKIHIGTGALIADSASLQHYIRETKPGIALTRVQERELILQAQQGNTLARNQIITANLRLVMQAARSFQGLGMPLEDIIAFGNIGLFEAVDRFDCSKPVKFITFAIWYIRAEMQKAIDDMSRVVRMPSHRRTESQSIKSIHMPIGDDENKETYADRFLEAETIISTRDRSDLRFDLNRALSQLNHKQREAVTRFYGIDREYAQCIEQIAEELEVTGERARQLVRQGERAIKKLPGVKLLEQYL
jgi:RNA polymerase primary sigma factor